MNPIQLLLERLAPILGRNPDLEAELRRFSEQFALVSKSDYDALTQQLAELNQQVAQLEARLKDLPD
ncbi:MAG: hypothetical protein GKR90_18915 [Pseudomonadales bacterium]|nr:hypothetical protein [Pseudomonadales bacterium]